MGTSISHRSPSTSNWRAATTAYKSPEVGIERATQEIWRAATNQPMGNLVTDLGTPIVARCLQLTIETSSSEDAVREAGKEIALSGQASLAADIAQRAIVQSYRQPQALSNGFVKSLFSEAVNYLVSRDLSGYVGNSERIRNVTDSIDFKKQTREQVESIVDTVHLPEGVERDADKWQTYVSKVVSRLAAKD